MCTLSALLAIGAVQLPRSALLRQATAASVSLVPASLLAIPPPDILALAPDATDEFKEQVPKVLYTPPSVKGLSTPDQMALAKHLQDSGAKFYGAYWCSFCLLQRNMFGAGGVRSLPYIECASDGYQSASGACRATKQVTGYPTWEIGGKFYGGMLTLTELQALSAFDPAVKFPEYVPPPPPPRPPPPPGGYKPPPVTTASTPEQLALASHLQSSGAKFYGAYWCRYCGSQRVMFGAEGAGKLPYVECASDGYQSASAACRAKAQVNSYPTWEIDGKFYRGMQEFDELAVLSGFRADPKQASLTSSTALRGDGGCSLSAGADASDCQ